MNSTTKELANNAATRGAGKNTQSSIDFEAIDVDTAFKKSSRLSRSPNGRLIEDQIRSQPEKSWFELAQVANEKNEAVDTREPNATELHAAHFTGEMPCRRHTSPEVDIQQGLKRSRGIDVHFSSPSLKDTKSVKAFKQAIEAQNVDEEQIPPTKKKRKRTTIPKRDHYTSMIEEAKDIGDHFKSFVTALEKKVSKNNQSHMISKVSRLIEIIEVMGEELRECSREAVPPQSEEEEAMIMSGQAQDKMIMEVVTRVTPIINQGLEKIMGRLVERTNDLLNKQVKKEEIKETIGTTRQWPEIGGQRTTSKGGNKSQAETSNPSKAQADSRAMEDSNGEEWTIVKHKRMQNAGRPTVQGSLKNRENLMNLIPKPSTGHMKEQPVSITIDIDQDPNAPLTNADKAAILVDSIDLNPEEIGNKVKQVNILRDGRLKVVASNEQVAEQLHKTFSSKRTEDLKVKCTIIQARRPRMMVSGIPQAWPSEKVHDIIMRETQQPGKEASSNENIKPLFKRGPKTSSTAQWVIAVNASARNTLLDKSELRYGLLTFKIKDYVDQPLCFNCQKYGHIGRNCTESSPTCRWCGNKGHSVAQTKQRNLSA